MMVDKVVCFVYASRAGGLVWVEDGPRREGYRISRFP